MYIDLLTKIKNAQNAGKSTLKVLHTKADEAVLDILERRGFLKKTEVKGRGAKKVMEIALNPERPIQGVKFLSRPSLRRYAGYGALKKVKGGQGVLVISTPKGILSGGKAREEKVGGVLLFEIW
ncbi:MAG: 30S ribosomal protein S8 [Candidatus Brennerbacteria bacterium]|nr:30S ribosomal protein S8 [Candidatus Brennerbacteria bacterium]